jgi:hypothetical protein
MTKYQASREPPSDVLVGRIRSLIATVALDCDCRQRVNEALGRFVKMEGQREARRHLLSSRHHRSAIAALAELLAELETVSWQETDRSVFAEFAHLFDDIAQHALRGAQDLRLIDGQST